MAADGIRGVEIEGSEPKELLLSDGSRLCLETEPADGGRVVWRRCTGGVEGDRVSLGEALKLAGDEYSRYVAVRTRAEVEWMRTVAEWYREQAELLSRELHGAKLQGATA
jgi:hypothetical protein